MTAAAPTASASAPAPVVAPPAAPAKPGLGRRARIVLPTLVVVIAAIAGGTYLLTKGHETTDDAQVEGRVATVAARVQGQVAKVFVQDNQVVKEGDLLVLLDDAELAARLLAAHADTLSARATLASAQAQLALTEKNIGASLEQAKGGLNQASSGVAATKAQLDQTKADITAAESRKNLAQLELARGKQLLATDTTSQADVDTRQANYDQAAANLEQVKARVASAQATIESSYGGVTLAKGRLDAAQTGPEQVEAARAAVAVADARVKQAEAAEHLAEINVSYTKILAPMNGTVARRTVEAGQNVSPDRPLFAIVPNDLWVVANFKEDQIGRMKQGQKAHIKIDTFGSRELAAHVDSIAGGTGSRFALLPPDNASGNFVKVVQRVPVLLRFDGDTGVTLRPGLSAEVSIDVGN